MSHFLQGLLSNTLNFKYLIISFHFQYTFAETLKTFGYQEDPLKNMTGILMEIPCHFMSQIDSSLVQTVTKFHENSMSFIQVLFVFHAQT